jgi:hypothetical protein
MVALIHMCWQFILAMYAERNNPKNVIGWQVPSFL